MNAKKSYSYDFSIPGTFTRMGPTASSAEKLDFQFYVNDCSLIDLFGCGINPLYADWIDIAMSVYLADRVSLRDPRRFHREDWVRRIRLRICVRSIDFWQQDEVRANLYEILQLLTDDDWRIDFVPLSERDRLHESQRHLPFKPAGPIRAALFSGGLDSFSGAIRCIKEDPESTFVLVSCVTNDRQLHNQRKQIAWLRKNLRVREIIHQTVELGFDWTNSTAILQEPTQRSRGFLFSVIGSVAALNAGTRKLEIYENGVGAVNLPYDSSQIGSMNSRSVHPLTLLRAQRLAERVSGREFEIENPFIGSTKGEMCSGLATEGLSEGIDSTFSCDGFPVHESGKPQCGVCTSCLLRRVSLQAAGLGEIDRKEGYGTDLACNESVPSFNQLNGLRAMEFQYQRLSNCLREKEAWTGLVSEFPILQLIASELADAKQIKVERLEEMFLRLYQRYCSEWSSFSGRYHLSRTLKKAA